MIDADYGANITNIHAILNSSTYGQGETLATTKMAKMQSYVDIDLLLVVDNCFPKSCKGIVCSSDCVFQLVAETG